MTALSFLDLIEFCRIRVTFVARENIALPEYKGSVFRSSLSDAVRLDVCPQSPSTKEKCAGCPDRFECAFSILFNSFNHPDHPHAGKYTKTPPPYIVDPMPGTQKEFRPGETFGFELTLIGSHAEQLPQLIRAFHLMGKTGIGTGRGKFEPINLESLSGKQEYRPMQWFEKPERITLESLPHLPVQTQLTLNLETPVRIVEAGRTAIPAFSLLVRRLALRMFLLSHFHGGAPWPDTKPEELLDTYLSQIHVHDHEICLKWQDWQRHSGTQSIDMDFDGYVGQITFKGKGLAPLLPLISLGSYLHVGSSTTFGLGKYSMVTDGRSTV